MNPKTHVRTASRMIYTKICSARVSWMRPSANKRFINYNGSFDESSELNHW